MENIKIWCETNKERDAVLKEMEKRGWKLRGEVAPTTLCVYTSAPVGLFYDYNNLFKHEIEPYVKYTKNRDFSIKIKAKKYPFKNS